MCFSVDGWSMGISSSKFYPSQPWDPGPVGQTRHNPHGVGPQRLRQLPRHPGDAGGAAAGAGAQRSGAVSEVRARSVGWGGRSLDLLGFCCCHEFFGSMICWWMHEYRKFKWRAFFRALHCVAKNEVSGLQALSKWMQMAFVGCYLRFTGILFNSIKARSASPRKALRLILGKDKVVPLWVAGPERHVLSDGTQNWRPLNS